MQRITVLLSMALAAALPLGSAFAFTDKPVKLIVPAPPGGTIDVFARIISDQLAHEIKQPVVVETAPVRVVRWRSNTCSRSLLMATPCW